MKYHFAFDLDGTITTKEILPILARKLGIYREMAHLTRRTMDGELPFDQSFIKRVEMLKKIPISQVKKIILDIPLNKYIVNFIKENKERCHIVTQNLDVWVTPLLEKLSTRYLTSQADYAGDRLIGIKKILRKKTIHTRVDYPVVAIGEGFNDLEMMIDAPLSIAYGGIHKPPDTVLDAVNYAIYDAKHLCNFLKQLL